MTRLLCFFFFVCGCAFPADASELAHLRKRIDAHLLIEDYHEAERELLAQPESVRDSVEFLQASVALYAQAGWDSKLLAAWKKLKSVQPLLAEDALTLEKVSWGVLRAGAAHPGLMVRLYSLIGATMSQDMRGVNLVHQAMHQQNGAIRAVAAEFAGYLGDSKLRHTLLGMIRHESSWHARLQAVRSAGQLRMDEAKEALESIVADQSLNHEERMLAVGALVSVFDRIDDRELELLVESAYPGQRILACRLILEFRRADRLVTLEKLFSDSHGAVRQAAITAYSLMEKPLPESAHKLLDDPIADVAITAAWALPEKGLEHLKTWVEHPYQHHRLLAAGALSACGQSAVPLLQDLVKSHKDVYVRATAALGLIGQRVDVEKSADVLYGVALDQPELLMWWDTWPFRAVGPSRVSHQRHQPEVPETVDQLVRLDLLNILARLRDPRTEVALREYLKRRSWGISATAVVTLLEEGSEHAVEAAQKLLEDSDRNIRTQAALVLAMWGREEGAISVLTEAYHGADRTLKEQILQGLGRIRSKQSLAFLEEKLAEEAPTLRILAATAILQTLR